MSGHRTEADYVAQVAKLADENTALRIKNARLLKALKRLAALDDGDRQYWWHGEPEDAIKQARAALADKGTP